MRTKFRAAVGSLLLAGVVAVGVPATAQAATPGQQCQLWPAGGGAAGVYPTTNTLPDQPALYALATNDWFRNVAYGANDTYYGHGAGKPNGYLDRWNVVQSTCIW